MAFVISGNVLKVFGVHKVAKVALVSNGTTKILDRKFSTEKKVKKSTLTTDENEILKSVFISQSNNIFTNLAIEDWLYKNSDFNKHHILLIWRNAPCVVIGRHQNPWLESNMGFLAEKGIDIARRNSGGGTVYHDKGNLNLSFFTPRQRYNRKHNLEIITKALKKEWNLDIEITEKDDLLLNKCKISGTASKLGVPNAYHHCTLLVNANKSHLKESLMVNNDEIVTNATKSAPAHVMNLVDGHRGVTFDRLLSCIGWQYLRTTAMSMKDGGSQLIANQRGFQLINPTDQWFPGLNQIREEYRSWDWRFGKTPKFTVSRTFPVVLDSSKKVADPNIKVTLVVEKGEITDVSFQLHSSISADLGLLSSLLGKKYSSQTFDLVEKSLVVVEKETEKKALRA